MKIIKCKGSRYTIIRGGKPVAVLGPAVSSSHEKTLGELKDLLKKIPRLGVEAAAFDKDIQEARTKQPALPKGRPWA